MPSTFPITVDATALSNSAYLIMGPSGSNVFPPNSPTGAGWTENSQAYTVEMPEGDYLFQIESGGVQSFHFQVQSNGTVTYPADGAQFLAGEGTPELRVLGYKVQIDARYITAQVVWSSNLCFAKTPISLSTYNLIPLPSYQLSVLNESYDLDWFFGIDLNGKFSYNNAFDYANGGFLQGQGTTTLVLLGYPLLVDARNSGGSGVRISPGTGVPFAPSGVSYANLLPEVLYALELEDGVASSAQFKLSDAGEITLLPELPWKLSLDLFHPKATEPVSPVAFAQLAPTGVPRITVSREIEVRSSSGGGGSAARSEFES